MLNVFLEKITEISGTSGYENNVAEFVSNEFKKHCAEVSVDAYFNVVGLMRGDRPQVNKPKVLLCAHMDEIALMIKKIDDCGFLRVSTVGGFDVRLLPGLEVIVHGREQLKGVFGAKPPHLQKKDEAESVIKLDDLFIDVGFSAERVREIVQIGDIVTYCPGIVQLKNNYIACKTMDDRAGVSILIQTMQELEKIHFGADAYFAATVQEEVGTKGASMVGYRIAPDIGIAIDVTHGASPDAAAIDTVPMDKGISITHGPNIHPILEEKLRETAKKYNITYVDEICTQPTGTDARALQIAGCGIPTLLLSIPLRYMHTPNEVLNTDNVEKAGRLLALFISEMKEDWEEWISY